MRMENEFYTVDELAEIVRLHPSTIRKAISNGRIHAFRAGYGKKSPLRIPKSELGRIQVMDMKATLINLKSLKG